MRKQKIYLFAGESSGDLHGSALMRALKPLTPNHRFVGVGGPQMRAQGLSTHIPMEEFEVMGLSDVLGRLPSLWGHFRQIRELILKEKPVVVIFIDYPGFNLKMAKALRKDGYQGKLVHYISPSVWAWGKHRIEHMARTLDLLLTIFPFEKSFYSQSSLPVTFVGNPLLEYILEHPYSDLPIPSSDHLVALFPGSRAGEIARNLPEMLRAALLLRKEEPRTIFGISCAHGEATSLIHEELAKTSLKLNLDVFLVPKTHRYELMRASCCALAKSGTVTLELALHEKPTVVVYNLSWLNRLYAKYFLRLNLPHYCIVNILSGQKVFPELIAEGYQAESMARHLSDFVNPSAARKVCQEGCQKVKELLQGGHASANAAQAVAELLT